MWKAVLRKCKIVGMGYIAGESGIDASTESLQTVDYPHHEIHSGSSFTYADTHVVPKNTVAPDHLIVTPDTDKYAHFVLAIGASAGSVKLEVFEDTVVSDNGDVEPLFNRNRNSATLNTTVLYEDPTVTTTGTRIIQATFGSRDKKSAGGDGRGTQEWMLKRNTKYLIRVTELDVANTTVNLEFDWYEHTDKN